jgi:chromosome segregation ATPase
MAAIERLERHIDELKQHQRESTLQIDYLKRELTFQKNRHQRQTKNLKRDLKVLLNSRRKIICREIVVSVYDALGHNPKNPRQTTFQYIRDHPNILEDAFQTSPNDIQRALDALDSQRNWSWIKMGNGEAHVCSATEAGRVRRWGT